MKKLRGMVTELFWAVTKNMAVGNERVHGKLEVIVDDREE